ncbi:MAG: exostosin-like glycosyltransferase [Monoraphidium minutum]|nr:MAG: exostosin-like glycosyltransferase [Monoraphidium minutum]
MAGGMLLFAVLVTAWATGSPAAAAGSASSGKRASPAAPLAAAAAVSLKQPPAPRHGHHPPQQHAGRCVGTVGSWCSGFAAQPLVPYRRPPIRGAPCPGDCSGVGVCHGDTGACDCPAGWGGPACADPAKRPCTRAYRTPRDSPAPNSHIGPDKRDLDWAAPGSTFSRRAPRARRPHIAACYCDPELGSPKHGRLPPPPGSPPGAPPLRRGRPLPYPCSHLADDGRGRGMGNWATWGVAYDKVYGPGGWCVADAPQVAECRCELDGMGGPGCDLPGESFCPNQCGGRGRCDLGFCRCDAGWWGLDCAHAARGGAAAEGPVRLPPWLAELAVDPWSAGARAGGVGARGRRRPLVYVYDVPAAYVSRMLQYRMYRDLCVWRWFDAEYDNATLTSAYPYGAEPLFLEMLLMSGHRTLDPEEADFFYVPLLATCWMHPVSGWADHPWWYVDTWSRVSHAVVMTSELLAWVKGAHPYWNASGGSDHLWLFAHDEGACWAPAEVYESSVILTHWGRLDRDPASGTSYGPDNYTADVTDDPFNPAGFTRLIGRHACYTPGKDVVIPLFRGPDRYHASPYLGAPQAPRDILLFHRGRMGDKDGPAFSRGVRQQVAKVAKAQRWRERYNISVGGYDEIEGDYSELLARSVFCLVAAGDGWSARFDDAMLHGCIPVVVIDKVVGPWGHQLRWQAFSVRVAQADTPRLPEILLAISNDRVRQMQRAMAAVWHRFAWLGHPLLHRQAREVAAANAAAAAETRTKGLLGADADDKPWLRPLAPGQWRDDAFGTVMQVLHHKLEQRRAAAAAGGAAAGAAAGAAPGAARGGEDGGGAPQKRHRHHHQPWQQQQHHQVEEEEVEGGGGGEGGQAEHPHHHRPHPLPAGGQRR